MDLNETAMNLIRLILKALGVYRPKTVEQIIAPLKETMEDLKSAVVERTEAVAENKTTIEELLAENKGHVEEIDRANRVFANIEKLLT